MAIEIKINNKNKSNADYPKLMVGTETNEIVLFTDKTKGTVLNTEQDGRKIGQHITDWGPECFKDYNGSIALSNK